MKQYIAYTLPRIFSTTLLGIILIIPEAVSSQGSSEDSKTDPVGFGVLANEKATSAFVPIEGFEDFGGWVQTARFDQAAIFDVSPIRFSTPFGMRPESIPSEEELELTLKEFGVIDYGGYTIYSKTVPPNTESLTLKTDTVPAGSGASNPFLTEFAPQLLGFSSFQEEIISTSNNSVFVDADKLYMIKWSLSTPFDAIESPQLPLVQLIAGENGSYGLGRSLISFSANGANNLVGDHLVFRQYFYAHDYGEIGFHAYVFDQATAGTPAASEGFPIGHQGHEFTINRIDVFEVDESKLTGETVIFNQGQEDVPLLDAEPEPSNADYAGGFDLDLWAGRDAFRGIGLNHRRLVSSAPSNPLIPAATNFTSTEATANILSFTVGWIGTGPVYHIWDTYNSLAIDPDSDDPIKQTSREIFEVDEGRLVFMDFWLSSTGSTSVLPFSRVGMSSAQVGPNGVYSSVAVQGYSAFHEFEPRSTPFERGDGSIAEPAIGLLDGFARRARLVWEVQLTSTPGNTGGAYAFRPALESYLIPTHSPSVNSDAVGTINMHRVVVTTYDPPVGAETAVVPHYFTDL